MASQHGEETQSVKERLQLNALILEAILSYRRVAKSPGFGWGIEHTIVGRELTELEEDIQLNPSRPAHEAAGALPNLGTGGSQERRRRC
jgi:hypothetical protein